MQAALLVDSLRTFGGDLARCPVWLIQGGAVISSPRMKGQDGLRVIPQGFDRNLRKYIFSSKVSACSQAEALAEKEGVSTLVWLSSHSLVLAPPEQFLLSGALRAALRPVHIRNVGSPADEPIDAFWQKVYRAVGLDEAGYAVESLVDGELLRPYYNTHILSVDPSAGILRQWRDRFMALVSDESFQSAACEDANHRIFLHQAVFSALVVKMLGRGGIRELPMEYSYPLHLHEQIPRDRAAGNLNQLVVPVYEDYYGIPEAIDEIEVLEPLGSWLKERLGLED